MISAQEFINQTIGKKKDMDGAYSSQCWDYFAYFESLAGYARTNCTQTGYVADIWNYRKSNGVLKNFKEVSKSSLQKGDWIIWTKSPYGSYSHIAMFVEYAGNNKVKVISQNQSNTMEACYATLTMNGIGGCLRPNCYPTQSKPKPSKPSTGIPSGFTKENATFVVGVDVLNVRDQPSTKGKIVAQYDRGQSFFYDCYCRKSDYVWVSYVSTSGHRRYVAVRESKTNKAYGTFK